ncbi:hypothetical protein [uncultured Prevotella sp.]|uniref:hypothetical protein n=1 Tax=uncultured Prevotella sp. TaxID=159272 RepID=UPI002584DF87|nr:hypothetical protein [uncultured Prevotella sp.]
MNAPANRKLPSFVACLAPLCALATRVRLNYYYDGQRQSALLLQVIIEAPQSSGKQFAADIERLLMDHTLKAHDQEQRRLEQKYRERRRNRGQNEKMEDEPKTTIRVIPATISKTVLVKRADFYERNLGDVLTFWMFAEELAQVTDAGKQGYSNLRTIMRTAYDFGSRFGMDFASDNSYSAIVDINICSMFCATPSALDDYMDKKAVEGGNITRTVLCQLEDQIGADGAMFKPYTPEQIQSINGMLDRLMADTYTPEGALKDELYLDTSWIDRDVRRWCQQKGKEALQTGSSALDVFRKRSSVSAYRIMALCYYLYLLEAGDSSFKIQDSSDVNRRQTECHQACLNDRGAKEEDEVKPETWNLKLAQKRCRKIYLFFADYILQMLLRRWGKTFEDLQARRVDLSADTGRPKLIDRLPREFSRDQLRALIQEAQVATPDRILVSQWKANHWIEEKEKFQYLKLI